MQQHQLPVEGERLGVVGPRLLLEAPVRLHQRREAAELRPAQQQLLGAALHQPPAEVAAHVVRPVGVAARGGRQRRRHQRAQRPEVRGLVAAPGVAHRLLARPAAAPEQDALVAVGVLEGALHRAPVQAAVGPGGIGAAAPVGEAGVGGEVVALAVVGLDPLHAELEHRPGQLAPPVVGRGRGEVHRRAGAHPPARDERLAAGVAHEVPGGLALGVVGGRLAVQPLGLGVGRPLAVDRLEVHPRRDPHHGPHPRLRASG